MMCRVHAICLVIGVASAGVVHAADPVVVQVVVKLRDKSDDKAEKPFADVGGFVLRRNNATYARATCPDLSNAQGGLSCKVTCEPTDGDMRLHLISPGRETARITAGLTPPMLEAIDISGCKVTNKLPLVVVYRSLEVIQGELMTNSPELFRALTVSEPGKALQIKPFASTATTLQGLSKDPKNRAAMLEFSRFATAYEETPSDVRTSKLVTGNIGQYANGMNSIVLKAVVEDVMGASAGEKVKLSSRQDDFIRSVEAVNVSLDAKPVLNSSEISLANSVRDIKTRPASAADRLSVFGR